MSSSDVFVWLCLAFIGGVLLGSLFDVIWPLAPGFLILSAVLIVWGGAKKARMAVIVGLCLVLLAGGILRQRRALLQGGAEQAALTYGRKIIFEGVVVNEPRVEISRTKFQVKSEVLRGRVLITAPLEPEYRYGDRLRIAGRLIRPKKFDNFDYEAYLAKDEIYSIIYYPQIKPIARNNGFWLKRAVFNFKNLSRKVIDKTLLPPQSAILKAILLGDKHILSANLKNKLNITGTRHIAAVSGLHMVIMSQIILALALSAGLRRGQAFYLVAACLALYILMLGLPASAVRAGIMAGLLLLAQKLGRLNNSARGLVFSAVLMLSVNPLLLSADVGFQLSFTAVLSIIYLKPIIDKAIVRWPGWLGLKDILAMTMAAQMGVLPLLVFHFGRISLISPAANLVIVPFLPVIMISGIILILSGIVWLPLAKIIVWPSWFLLTCLVGLIDYLAGLPFAAYEIKNAAWLALAGYSSALAVFIYWKVLKGKSRLMRRP